MANTSPKPERPAGGNRSPSRDARQCHNIEAPELACI